MIDTNEITRRLDVLETTQSQQLQLMNARFESVEASIEALSKKLDARFLEIDRKIEGLNEKMRLLLTHTQKLLVRLEE